VKPQVKAGRRLTIAGGVREALLGCRLGREEIVRPRRQWPALLRGPSALPLAVGIVSGHLKSIRSKLTAAELLYLKDTFGIELRDPTVVAALTELEIARQRLAAFSAHVRSSHRDTGEPMACTFCGCSSTSVGPLVEAPGGACICKGCASHCIELIAESSA
jgi:hypothetical protein